ncbi:MAG: alkaline phosphatase family protein, partial [Anaerolineaceae bacterium]|nr:alkaline phosphatase family protein [Anaerolineaceae bacterium]
MNTSPLFILTIDGCAPGYIENINLPNIAVLKKKGFYKRIQACVPTVTNVNNTSILTGVFPEEHGIASNYWYNPTTDSGGWIETFEHLKKPTYFEKVKASGGRCVFITAKMKLQTLLGRNADIAISSEMLPSHWSKLLPDPPPLRDPQNSYWVIDT